jgi:hypothetical protein
MGTMFQKNLRHLLFVVLMFLPTAKAAVFNKVDRRSFESMNRSKIIADSNVIVVTNRFCEAGRSFLTENFNSTFKKNSFSAEESHLVTLKNPIALDALENIAQSDDCVVSVSKDIPVELYGVPNDPQFSKQSHLPEIHYAETFSFFSNLEMKGDAVIAIIDNGLTTKHEDIKDNLWVNEKEKNGLPGIDDDENGYIDDVNGYDFIEQTGDPSHKYTDNSIVSSHGTHVAALAAASTNNGVGVSGVMSKNVKIMGLNVFGKKGYSDFATIDTAIRYAADMGANVINMSLGGKGFASSTEKAIQYAVSKNVLVVVAAGNDNEELTDTNFISPGSYGAEIDGMITVGATATGSKAGELCSFSNHSTKYVELGAPGCHNGMGNGGLLSALKRNYGYMAGTSMASPVAAGVALIAYSYARDHFHKKLKPAQLEEYIKSASKSSSLLEKVIQDGKIVDLQSLKDKIISNGQ